MMALSSVALLTTECFLYHDGYQFESNVFNRAPLENIRFEEETAIRNILQLIERRRTKTACYEVKCWAQFPERTPLYDRNYVSRAEAASLGQELAWVPDQKASGAFLHTPFEQIVISTQPGINIAPICYGIDSKKSGDAK
jgi:hypothetical protein